MDSWSTPQQFSSATPNGTSLLTVTGQSTGSSSRYKELVATSTFQNYQGYYVRIYMLVNV